MNAQDQVGKLLVIRDYATTDTGRLYKGVTRFLHNHGSHDVCGAESYARLEADEVRAQTKAKTRHRHTKVYVVQVVSVIDVFEDEPDGN